MVVTALGLAAVSLLTTWLLAGVHRRRPWDAAIFAVSPMLALTGLVNWDLVAFALVAGAVEFGSRRGRRVVNIVPAEVAVS